MEFLGIATNKMHSNLHSDDGRRRHFLDVRLVEVTGEPGRMSALVHNPTIEVRMVQL
jgi:hypothetical protein